MPGPSLEIGRHYGRLSPTEEAEVVEELAQLVVGLLTQWASQDSLVKAPPGPEAFWMRGSVQQALQDLPVPAGGVPS